MDEDIEKLLKYINTHYRKGELGVTIPELIKEGFDERIIKEAKWLDYVEVLPLVHSTPKGEEDARVVKLTKEGLKFVKELKNPNTYNIRDVNINSPKVGNVSKKGEVNINYGKQEIHKHITDNSTNYEIDKQDVTFIENASVKLIAKYGEKKLRAYPYRLK